MSTKPAPKTATKKPPPPTVNPQTTKKKPVPSAPKPQTTAKKPVPSTPKPQTTTKKPIPSAPKPQSTTALQKKKPAVGTAAAKNPSTSSTTTTNARSSSAAQKSSGGGQSYVGQAVSAFTSPPSGPKADNWINRTVQSGVAGVGSYAGGWVNSVGDGVNKIGAGIGDSIAATTRHWGQGVAGYGNDIKDQVGIGGARVPTAGNPIGLQGMGSGKGAEPGGHAKGSGVRDAGKGSAGNHLGL